MVGYYNTERRESHEGGKGCRVVRAISSEIRERSKCSPCVCVCITLHGSRYLPWIILDEQRRAASFGFLYFAFKSCVWHTQLSGLTSETTFEGKVWQLKLGCPPVSMEQSIQHCRGAFVEHWADNPIQKGPIDFCNEAAGTLKGCGTADSWSRWTVTSAHQPRQSGACHHLNIYMWIAMANCCSCYGKIRKPT